MATKETQTLIFNTAIRLFNENGSRNISTNKIAKTCGISIGNLHYHFKNKEEIILFIFKRIREEMDTKWSVDHERHNVEYMWILFDHYVRMMWQYRFFFRELVEHLQRDAELRREYQEYLVSRLQEIEQYFEQLIKAGAMHSPREPISLTTLVYISRMVTENWLYHLDIRGIELTEAPTMEGFLLLVHIFEPYFTVRGRLELLTLLEEIEVGERRIKF